MDLFEPITKSKRTLFISARPELPGEPSEIVYDGDGLRAAFAAKQPMRFLGCDTPEVAYRVPISPTATKDRQKLDGPLWADFLDEPFAPGKWPEMPNPGLHPIVQQSLAARCGPDAAANHGRHAKAAREALVKLIVDDRMALGLPADQPTKLYLALSHEVFDTYGRLLVFANTDVADPALRPRIYNERQIANGFAQPFFIWPNVDPFRGKPNVTDAALPPRLLRLQASQGALGRSRADAAAARTAGIGIYSPADPLRLGAFELRMLGDRKLPSRWVIDLGADADDPTLLPPEGYPLVEHAENRLFVPQEYVPLFVQKGWQPARLVRW